jgi:hypothetical protein
LLQAILRTLVDLIALAQVGHADSDGIRHDRESRTSKADRVRKVLRRPVIGT